MCSSILSSSDSSRKPSLLVSNTRYTSSISSWLMGLTGGQEDGAGAGRGQVNHAVRQGGIAPDHEAAGEQEEGGRGRWVGDGRRRSGLRGKDVGPGTSCIASGGSAPYNRAMCMGPAVTAPLPPGEGVWQHGHSSPRPTHRPLTASRTTAANSWRDTRPRILTASAPSRTTMGVTVEVAAAGRRCSRTGYAGSGNPRLGHTLVQHSLDEQGAQTGLVNKSWSNRADCESAPTNDVIHVVHLQGRRERQGHEAAAGGPAQPAPGPHPPASQPPGRTRTRTHAHARGT